MVDHYASGINLIVFLFIQLIVFVYLLPLSDLEKRINQYGETFPNVYKYSLKILCPIFALFLTGVAIVNEYKYPRTTDSAIANYVGYLIMAAPTLLTVGFYIWNPFGKDSKKSAKGLLDSESLLRDAEKQKQDDIYS